MKKITKEFEKTFGVSINDISDRESLIKLLKDERFKGLIKSFESLSSLLEDLLDAHKGTEFEKDLFTFKVSSDMANNEIIISNLFDRFSKKEIDTDTLKEELKKFLTSEDPLFVIAAALCSLIGTDMNLMDETDNLTTAIAKIESDVFPNLGSIKDSYQVRCDILDLCYQFREYYFVRNQVDLFLEDESLEDEMRKVSDYEESIMPEIPDSGIAPEEVGYIDITKLNKGDDADAV